MVYYVLYSRCIRPYDLFYTVSSSTIHQSYNHSMVLFVGHEDLPFSKPFKTQNQKGPYLLHTGE